MKLRKYAVAAVIVIVAMYVISSFGGDTSSNSTKITAVANETNITYYGPDTLAGKSYTYAIEVNSTTYYFDDSIAEKISTCNNNKLNWIINWDLQKYDNKPVASIKRPGEIIGANIYMPRENDYSQFSWPNEGNFSFTYKNGTVGANKNANIIENVYYINGTEIPTPESE